MHLTSPSSTPSTTPEMSLWRPDDTTRATAALPGAADGVWRSDILDAIEETIAGMDEELRALSLDIHGEWRLGAWAHELREGRGCLRTYLADHPELMFEEQYVNALPDGSPVC